MQYEALPRIQKVGKLDFMIIPGVYNPFPGPIYKRTFFRLKMFINVWSHSRSTLYAKNITQHGDEADFG
ncbi:hypothetical protein D3C73_1633750 [compost metagenome]